MYVRSRQFCVVWYGYGYGLDSCCRWFYVVVLSAIKYFLLSTLLHWMRNIKDTSAFYLIHPSVYLSYISYHHQHHQHQPTHSLSFLLASPCRCLPLKPSSTFTPSISSCYLLLQYLQYVCALIQSINHSLLTHSIKQLTRIPVKLTVANYLLAHFHQAFIQTPLLNQSNQSDSVLEICHTT